MGFIIRNGEVYDVKAILGLIKELAVFEKLPNEVEVTEDDLIRDGFSANPKFKTIVAEESNGNIVGMALFYERYSTWKGRIIHLEDLMVTQSKRGIGAGKALYTAVLNYAHVQGCKRVSWEVLDWNKGAIDFYESTGATILDGWQVVQMNEKSLKEFVKKN
ncbi:Acetyltransferase (GNAT) family protein [Tenacibaculum sp. MAR_2009_124]|uniref:GNAT family N-acetyltransferase n=1 Tax=Tenacibaculum sp. MAR_2009_124 TaxID=1250059 RepID=UPI00089B02E5|nr:GNAT family N-acetyltransferase [Tenacibaculum sp. MAR_2009_124]SEC27096.1 Acetyltransferase (GNAT) family protein [Tenacibaculum sp. MAR_2009_124]